MKRRITKIVSVIMALVMALSVISTAAMARKDENGNTVYTDPILGVDKIAVTTEIFKGMEAIGAEGALGNNIMKVLYNMLNILVENLLRDILAITPDPQNWQSIDEYDADEVCFLEGRSTYQTSAKDGNHWSLGYSSRSFVPEDIGEGRYYIGRDVKPRIAEGVYDDNRIRVCVIDDNSGEGAVVFGAIDSLGVTSTDVRSIRAGVLEYCEKNNIKVSSIDICATHAHTALDTQGVGTAFFYKLFLGGLANLIPALYNLPFLADANYFKEYFIEQSIIACEEAFEDMEDGKLYYDQIDASHYMHDKRDLIDSEDLPDMASLKFVPDSGSEPTYITDVGCHPTSFGADSMLVSSDYIYYLDNYIKEKTGGNTIIVQGALGQVSRQNINESYDGLTEWEALGEESKVYGEIYADLIISGDYATELEPIINVKHKEIWLHSENSLLVLACEVNLVNNKVYYREDGEPVMASEIGYLEFGNKLGFAMFPGELYPETFWGTEISGDVSWDGETWDYPSMGDSVEGVDVYPISLMNDATGYVVPDNYFAFMGHIAGIDDQVADELLSVGKHEASFLLDEYLDLIKGYVK